ncbi:MAG: phosphoribosylanthranilate isomerase [Bacteroidales bacterium]|nr:phosphoribosylanthranilate isomerase [Bacteroidales bacterium]
MKIKVCGMRDRENIQELLELHPDYIGFIFYEKSVRYIGGQLDPSVTAVIPEDTGKVGVFVNADPDDILGKIDQYGLDYIQLHGRESAVYCTKLANEGVQIIKAFSVDDQFSFSVMDQYMDCCRYFLFDTRTTSVGGSGKKFNWEMLNEYSLSKPFFLSGGIGPDDAEETAGLRHMCIHALDINSRFETMPGYKNIDQVKKFIEKIRAGN